MSVRSILLTAIVMLGLVVFTAPATIAQTCDGTGKNFIDLDGDGFNDNAPDHDGDGIPNGLDDDYVKYAQDGTGYQNRNGKAEIVSTDGTNGSGIQSQNHNRFRALYRETFQNRFSALNGLDGLGAGARNGSGSGMAGDGICDGTGPHGLQKQGGK